MSSENSLKQAEEEKKAKVTSRWIHRGRTIHLRIDTFEIGHKTKEWDIVEHPGAAVIIPVTEKNTLLLVKQWRRAVEKILIELPAGTLDAGEQPLECAMRELQEETGFKAHRFTSLGGVFSAPGFCTEFLHLYLAQDLEPSSLPHDETEAIDLVEVTLEKALQMIDEQVINDAKTVAGIFKYTRWIQNLKV